MTKQEQVALWEAINRYAEACGGDTSTSTVSLDRMRAVALVERAVSSIEARRPDDARAALEGAEIGRDDALQAAEDVVPPLTFDRLRIANVRRCSTHYHPIADWSLSDWCTAVAGELGELAGVIKNLRRAETEQRNGHKIPQRGPLVDALAEEAADTVIYLDLLCARAAVDLGAAVTRKFNRVSRERLNTTILLPEKP